MVYCYKLSLNTYKNNYIIVDNRKLNKDLDIQMANSSTIRVNMTTFLGVGLYNDEKPTWKYHINSVKTKLGRTVGVMYRAVGVMYRAVGVMYRAVGVMQRAAGLMYRAIGVMYKAVGVMYTSSDIKGSDGLLTL